MPIVAGRAMVLELKGRNTLIEVFNIHNEDIDDRSASILFARLRSARAAAARDPASRACFLAGDFNFNEDGEASMYLDSPEIGSNMWHDEQHMPAIVKRWKRELGAWTEHHPLGASIELTGFTPLCPAGPFCKYRRGPESRRVRDFS